MVWCVVLCCVCVCGVLCEVDGSVEDTFLALDSVVIVLSIYTAPGTSTSTTVLYFVHVLPETSTGVFSNFCIICVILFSLSILGGFGL